jgi:hypothetical protein
MNRAIDDDNQVDSVLSADGRRPERPPTRYRATGARVKRGRQIHSSVDNVRTPRRMLVGGALAKLSTNPGAAGAPA